MEDNGAKIFTDKKNQVDSTACIYTSICKSVHDPLKVEAISINEAEFSKLFNNQSFCDKHFSGKLVVFMIYALLLVLEQTYLAGN